MIGAITLLTIAAWTILAALTEHESAKKRGRKPPNYRKDQK